MSSVVPSTASSMYLLAIELADAVAAAMATTAAGAPDATYVTLGSPAFAAQCSQAVVGDVTLGEGNTNPTTPPESVGMRHKRGRVNKVGMIAYAMRCVPVTDGNDQYLPQFTAPSPGTESAIALAAYEDGWAVWNYVNRAIREGLLFNGPCVIADMVGGVPYAPEAGLGGWRFACRVELDGYNPTGS